MPYLDGSPSPADFKWFDPLPAQSRCTCDYWGMCEHCERRAEGDERDAQNEALAEPPEQWDFPQRDET